MEWYRNLNARPRLVLAFGILMVLSLATNVVAIFYLGQANERVHTLYEKDVKGILTLDTISSSRIDLAQKDRDAMIKVDQPEVVKADHRDVRADFAKMREALETSDQYFYAPEGKALVAEMRADLPAYQSAVYAVLDATEANDILRAKQNLIALAPQAAKMAAQIDRAIKIKQQLTEDKYKENNRQYQIARGVMLGSGLLSLVLGISLSLIIANGFSKPLANTAEILEKVADGDLTVSLDIDTNDEIGRMASALNQAVGRLNRTMREVAASAANASSSSQQLAAASEAISSGAQEQAASLEETSASLEEITATVRNTADNAQQASQLAAASKESALEGQSVVSSAVTAMAEIDAASAKISDIISTIDEIAFQTNLLAVNAAVEAARAGEEGRGFAVVASEVRSLAQRSAVAAKEIKTLIQDSLWKVESGSKMVNRSGETLQGIVNSVKHVTDIVGEIAASAREQSAGVEQVNTAMTQMDHVTQSNSAQTEELSATAESLSEQSANLLRLIQTFKLTTEDEGVGRQLSAPLQRAVATGPRKIAASKSKFGAAKNKAPFTRPTVALAAHTESDGNFEEF